MPLSHLIPLSEFAWVLSTAFCCVMPFILAACAHFKIYLFLRVRTIAPTHSSSSLIIVRAWKLPILLLILFSSFVRWCPEFLIKTGWSFSIYLLIGLSIIRATALWRISSLRIVIISSIYWSVSVVWISSRSLSRIFTSSVIVIVIKRALRIICATLWRRPCSIVLRVLDDSNVCRLSCIDAYLCQRDIGHMLFQIFYSLFVILY